MLNVLFWLQRYDKMFEKQKNISYFVSKSGNIEKKQEKIIFFILLIKPFLYLCI